MSAQPAPNSALTFAIRPIAATQTYALRHAVLWPDQPLSYVQLPEDAAGQHFGAFGLDGGASRDGELRAVISLFVGADGEARFRKFATHPAWQGRGLGSALLGHVLAVAQTQGARAVWCDARHNTLPFYLRFGLAPAGDVFYKGPITYQRLRKLLA